MKLALAAATLTALVTAAVASAHANVGPPVVLARKTQMFTLAVPTEKEGARTVNVELTPPRGFALFSFEDAPGWKREEEATGSGEERSITKVIWSGPGTADLAVFRFIGRPESAKEYAFKVRQTYSDGEVVDWTGSESSDTPAPVAEAVSSLGGDSGGGSSSTLAVIALIVAGAALAVAGVSLVAGRRPLA
ncbi:MAG: DUF1775 domain-containing protein [Actinomycetota bacterium]|nr:DUF1775 domain-containing protein [Actinomycetota bacterium]